MPDNAADLKKTDSLTCRLCIVGAGIAGLNALFVATKYLSQDDRVVLIDGKPKAGGMWNDTYGYVRLHQPHPMFTAGNLSWDWSKPPDYLATGAEVQAHLERCLEALRAKVDLVELYGHHVQGYEEVATDDGTNVRIKCRASEDDGEPHTIAADKMVNATGFDIRVPEPLALSSGNVISTTPQRLDQDLSGDATSPIYVVGGGKTGMDTAHMLLSRYPGRQVSLLVGEGTVFYNRSKFLPAGARRWWNGQLFMTTLADLAMRFDGSNEDEVFDYFRDRYAISLDGKGDQCFFGLMSEDENAFVAKGIHAVIKDYLDDVVDTDGGPEMLLRGGERLSVPPRSIFVNCTGMVLRTPHAYRPYLSLRGAIVSITPRSAVYFLSSVASYFLVHLFLSGRLKGLPLYELDAESLIGKGRKVWLISSATLSFMNVLIMMNAVPLKVLDECGLDIDRWYPQPRRLAGLVKVRINHRRYVQHCQNALDRVQDRLQIRCGRLANDASEERV